ncbi:hypothetical protein FJY68_07055 [candidate division WOR-3 bacterium]|uniref:DUF3108 domain-containing protein n=1 Tax=candidate division WOR-3 bacterium TaxID=2052148 RepID=A0A937XEJ0_UNCW3|nr:hypothetical protein [candidate division WOR-3 bacterium]
MSVRRQGSSKLRIHGSWLAACGWCLLLACVTEDLGPMPAFDVPQWRDGEISRYVVTRNDSALYRSAVTLEFDEEMNDGGQGDSVRLVPTLVVTNVIQPLPDAEWFFDSVHVVFRRDNLSPLRTYRAMQTDISEFELTARFSRGRVQIEKQTIDGATEELLRLPGRFHSYDMVQTWLRAVPLVSGTSFRDNLVVPFEFRTVPVKFLVLGTKLIPTNVGDIMCREIVLILPTREVRFWYELAQPHRFVGLNDIQNNTKMVLESYRAGHADTLPPVP